jgi:hypothetical protein
MTSTDLDYKQTALLSRAVFLIECLLNTALAMAGLEFIVMSNAAPF